MTGTQTLSQRQAAAELLRRRRARDSLVGYVEAIDVPGDPANGEDSDDGVFLPVGSGMALHHRVLCEALQRCITREGGYGRLMVFMPPGAAKSTYCSVVAPTWAMGRTPGERIILAMHNGDIAKKQGRKARSVVRQRVYGEIFPGATLSKETSAAEMWTTGNASEYMAAGIRSGIAGNRAGGMVIDDPIRGRKDADSALVRADTLAAWQDDLVTRLMPRAWVVLVQTRWHEGDLAGSLLPADYAGQSGPVLCRDGMVWEVLNIPAEANRADDPLGRGLGDMLWPEWFDERHWIAARRVPRTWSALYQQNPLTAEGTRFKRAWFDENRYSEAPARLNRFTTSDYAVTDENDADDPDYTSHAAWGMDDRGHLYALDWYSAQVNSEVGIRALIRLAKRALCVRGYGEVGVIRRAIEPAFKRLLRDMKSRLSITYLPHIGDKEVSAMSFQALASAGMVHFPEDSVWAERVIDQLCGFPAVVHDDDVDCCSLAGRAVDQVAFARGEKPEEQDTALKPWTWAWIIHGTEGKDGPVTDRVM